MAFEPDILVTDRDSNRALLLVEAKYKPLGPEDLAASEGKLREYMRAIGCSLGALVSPTQLRIYQDSFRSYALESIELVADLDMSSSNVFAPGALARPTDFENALQAWIDSLRDDSTRTRLWPPLRAAVETYLLPALWRGEVRAAHHRYLATRASERRRGARSTCLSRPTGSSIGRHRST